MPQKYRVTTDQGVYEVTVDDPPLNVERAAPKEAGMSSAPAVGMAAASRAVPLAADAATEVATNPGVKQAGSMLGQILGGLQAAKTGDPLGVAGGVWVGGKAGWHTGALAQRMAAPVAAGLQKIAPYAQSLNTLGGLEGVDELAQMAEPTRKDIGTLGVRIGDQRDPSHPALLNLLWQKITGQ